MANYLELTQTTRLLCGMQGVGPSSVTAAQGVEGVLVRFVRDAYVDIQNMREDFRWMEAAQSFSTIADQDEYNMQEIFGVSSPPLKKYQKPSFIITNSAGKKNYLAFVERNVLEARYLNNTQTKLPIQYTIDPPTNNLILKSTPDGVYNVDFRYQKSPEILSLDAQVPALPLSFHNLIVYKATEKMAIYLGVPEIFREYSTEVAKMSGQLMRMELPKMRMSAPSLV